MNSCNRGMTIRCVAVVVAGVVMALLSPARMVVAGPKAKSAETELLPRTFTARVTDRTTVKLKEDERREIVFTLKK